LVDGIDEHLPCAVLSRYVAAEAGADSVVEFEPLSVSVRELIEADALYNFEGLNYRVFTGGAADSMSVSSQTLSLGAYGGWSYVTFQ
jgi:hypothetical protein